MRMKFLLFLFVASAFLLENTKAAAAEFSFDDFNARTVAGDLVVKKQLRRPDRVYLAGNVVLQSDADHSSWFVASAFARRGEARLVLLGFDTGVNACPYLYRVLEAHPDGQYSMTKDFGNCRHFEDPDFSTVPGGAKNTVRYKSGEWMLAFPKDEGDGSVWYVYKNGQIYRGGKLAPDPDY